MSRNRSVLKFLSIAALSGFLAAPAAQAIEVVPGVLGFDELPNATGGVHLPEGYGGFSWGSQWYQMSPSTGNTEANFLATSTSGGTWIFRADHSAFHFDGADFWSRRGADANGDFFFVLYGHDGEVLYNGNDDGNAGRMRFTGTAQLLQANYSGLIYGMAWGFDNDDADHLAMDNFRFRAAAIPAVPEPHAGLLALLGVGFLLGRRVRR